MFCQTFAYICSYLGLPVNSNQINSTDQSNSIDVQQKRPSSDLEAYRSALACIECPLLVGLNIYEIEGKNN